MIDSDPTTEKSGRNEGEYHPCHPRSLRQEEYKFKTIPGYRVRPYLMVGGWRIRDFRVLSFKWDLHINKYC